MDDNNEFNFGLRPSNEGDLNQNSEKNTDNENNRNEEQRKISQMNDSYNTPIFGINNYKNEYKKNYNNFFYNYNTLYEKQANIYNLYSNELFQNEANNKFINKNIISNETFVNEGELIHVNSENYIEQNDYKKTSNTSNKNNTVNLNGKQITTKNEAVTDALNEMFNKSEININNIQNLQFMKKKNKRRTKTEVKNEKEIKSKEVKNKLKLGRKRKNEISENPSTHSKNSDDNIIKKINSFFLESVRIWLNNSFINEFGNFETEKDRKKSKKGLFMKLDPKKITTNLKRKAVINIMDDKFKNIFSNDISKKYTTSEKNKNQKLIDELYKNNNQPFVIFILELKFMDIFNYFNGENNGANFKQYFLDRNINENKVNYFLDNFDKIGKFLSKVKIKQEKINEPPKKIQNYIEKITLLCLNYKSWFESNYNRSENKNKKEINIKIENNNDT